MQPEYQDDTILIPNLPKISTRLFSIEDLANSETTYSGNIMTQSFWVNPEGGPVNLFDGDLEIIIPKGVVSSSTELTMATFPVHHLDFDGYNMYIRGFSLTGNSPQQMFPNGITLRIRYDLEEEYWKKNLPADEEDLLIYWVSPLSGSYERVIPFKYCCVNCECNIIKGCIEKCGFYVVGEK